MDQAWIEGRPASAEDALAAAAGLLNASRLTVLTGSPGDVASVRALVRLAREVGGIVDHDGFAALEPLLSTLREAGIMLGAPAEIRRRADRYLLVGADPFARAPTLRDFVFSGARDLGRAGGEPGRAVLRLGGAGAEPLPADVRTIECDCAPADVGVALACLRAGLNGRRFSGGPVPPERIAEAVEFLKGAAFGCVVFAPADLDALAVELLCGLVEDLNATTRFCALPVTEPDGAFGPAQVCAWLTGFPFRAAFGRGSAEFDPDLNGAERRIVSGEADCAVHVGGAGSREPDWSGAVPVIALGSPDGWRHAPRVAFSAGPANGAVRFEPRFNGFVQGDDAAPGEARPDAAGLLSAIAARLPAGDAASC